MRKTLLALAAAATCVAHVAQAQTFTIDPQQVAARPLLKSKLGFARAVGFDRLPESAAQLTDVGARAFCSAVAFDDVSEGKRKSYAVDPAQFGPTGVRSAAPNPWFAGLLERLHAQGIEPYFGLIGAPAPYHPANIRKPAEHPTPLDIDRAAASVASWSKPYLERYPETNWIIWNEPEHALRGSNSVQAADDMARIYKAWVAAIDPISPYDGMGLAAFMKGSLRPTEGEPQRNFFQSVMDRTGDGRSTPRYDYITMNNYHGKTDEFVAMMQTEMGRRGLDQPLMFSQYAPWQVGEQADLGRSNTAAGIYLETLDGFQSAPSLNHICFSFWAGIDGKSFVRWKENGGGFERSKAYLALGMYQRLPLWRVAVPEAARTPDIQVYAAAERDRVGVLLAQLRRTTADAAPPPLADATSADKGARKEDRKEARKEERQRLRQESKAAERDGPKARKRAPQEVAEALPSGGSRTLTLELRGWASQPVRVERLGANAMEVASASARTDEQGRLQLSLGDGEIVFVHAERADTLPARANVSVVRQDVYVHRLDGQRRTIPEAELAVAAFDPKADGFVLEAPTARTTAHASAWMRGLPRQLGLHLETPPGQNAATAGACAAVLVQHMSAGQPVGLSAWGHPETVARMLASRHFSVGSRAPAVNPISWQAGPGDGLAMRLDTEQGAPGNWGQGSREARVHLALGDCAGPARAQVRLTN